MRTFRNLNAYVLAFAAVAFLANCGKKEDKKDSSPAKVNITEATVSDDGTARFAFDAEGVLCKFDTLSFKGTWTLCDGSEAQFQLEKGQAGTLSVRHDGGPITTKTIAWSGPSLGDPNQIDPNAQNVDTVPFGGPNHTISLANRSVLIPEGMFVTRYNYSNGMNPNNLKVFEVMNGEDPFERATFCQNVQLDPLVTTRTVNAVSHANGAPHLYCESTVPKPNVFNQRDLVKFMNNFQQSYNSIEFTRERTLPGMDYVSFNIYQTARDEQSTLSSLNQHCGKQAVGVNQRYPELVLPVLNRYYDALPANAVFTYCQKQITVGPGVETTVYVGGFKALRIGQTVDTIEFYRMVDASQAPAAYQFAKDTLNMVGATLFMSRPDSL